MHGDYVFAQSIVVNFNRTMHCQECVKFATFTVKAFNIGSNLALDKCIQKAGTKSIFIWVEEVLFNKCHQISI